MGGNNQNNEKMMKALSNYLKRPAIGITRQMIAENPKDIADMQVMDYITGYKRKFGSKALNIDLDSMLVISKQTADILTQLEPEAITEILGGVGVSEEEIHDCVTRFTLLKEKIKGGEVYPDDIKNIPGASSIGKLCIVRDTAWDKLSLYDMAKVHKHPRTEREMKVAWMLYYALLNDPEANYFGAEISYLYGIPPRRADLVVNTNNKQEKAVEVTNDYRLILGAEGAEENHRMLDKMLFKVEFLMGGKDSPAPQEFIEMKEDIRHAMEVNESIAQKARNNSQPKPIDIFRMQAAFDKLQEDAGRVKDALKGDDKITRERLSLADDVQKQAKQRIEEIKRADQQMVAEINQRALIDVGKIQKLQTLLHDYETEPNPTIEMSLRQLRRYNNLADENRDPSAMFFALKPRMEKVVDALTESPETLQQAIAAGMNIEDIKAAIYTLKLCEREEILANELRPKEYQMVIEPSRFIERLNGLADKVPQAAPEKVVEVQLQPEAPVLGSGLGEIPVLRNKH